MNKNALGLIEVVGKVATIEAADAALKAANVTLLGMESATGALITVKLTGDVSDVKAAVDAARIAAGRVGTVIDTQVLPRPANGIYPLLTARTPSGGNEPSVMAAEESVSQESAEEVLPPVEQTEPVAAPVPEAAVTPEEAAEEEKKPAYLLSKKEAETDSRAACNICHDPACPREKGQSVKLCIHA